MAVKWEEREKSTAFSTDSGVSRTYNFFLFFVLCELLMFFCCVVSNPLAELKWKLRLIMFA